MMGCCSATTVVNAMSNTPRNLQSVNLPSEWTPSSWRAYPALRSERAVQIFKRLRPTMLKALQKAANPDEALLALDGFLKGLPAGVQLFSLFEANPVLIDLIVDIAGTTPALARYLSRNAGVLDAVIGGSFFAPWPGKASRACRSTRSPNPCRTAHCAWCWSPSSGRRYRFMWCIRADARRRRGFAVLSTTPSTPYASIRRYVADALLHWLK